MKRTIFYLMALILTLTIFAGCRSVREINSGTMWNNELLFLIEKGKTTAKDIVYAFGAPQKEIIGGKGRIYIYYADTARYIFEGAVNIGMADGEHYSLTIWFDQNGVVTDYSLTYNKFESPNLKKEADRLQAQQKE